VFKIYWPTYGKNREVGKKHFLVLGLWNVSSIHQSNTQPIRQNSILKEKDAHEVFSASSSFLSVRCYHYYIFNTNIDYLPVLFAGYQSHLISNMPKMIHGMSVNYE